MSMTRFATIRLLTQQFSDPLLKTKCIESAQYKLAHQLSTRVFDEFPPLLPPSMMNELSDELHSMLCEIDAFTNINEEDYLLPKDEQRVVNQSIKALARTGIEQLLDTDGKIKQELIDLLQWHPYKNTLNSCDILCAFVVSTYHLLLTNDPLQHLINNDLHTASVAMLNFMNQDQHYRDCVIESMNEAGIPYSEKEKPSYLSDILALRPAQKAALAVGLLGGLAAAASIGIAFFVSANHKKEDPQELFSQTYPKL